MLQLPDVPPLEVKLFTGRAAWPQEDDLVVRHPAATGHVRVSAGKPPRGAVHVLDVPRHEPITFCFGWPGLPPRGRVRRGRRRRAPALTRRARPTRSSAAPGRSTPPGAGRGPVSARGRPASRPAARPHPRTGARRTPRAPAPTRPHPGRTRNRAGSPGAGEDDPLDPQPGRSEGVQKGCAIFALAGPCSCWVFRRRSGCPRSNSFSDSAGTYRPTGLGVGRMSVFKGGFSERP